MGSFGKKIRELRAGKMTVQEFASLLSKTPGYISRVEVQGEIPSAELVCRMALELDADAATLLSLAKQDQLLRTDETLSSRYAEALALHLKSIR